MMEMQNKVRPIDGNALLEKMQYRLPVEDDISEAVSRCARISRKLVERMPTLDVVTEIHGYWIDGYGMDNSGKKTYDSIDCSECDSIFKIESHDRAYWKERFGWCPFCGAKMDGDADG